MPTLPAPFPFLPTGGDLPVSDTDDALAAYPLHVKQVSDAPVRDTLVAGQTAMLLAYQERAAYAAAQSDPTRATGVYLDGHGADVGIYRQEIEAGTDEVYRDRIFAYPSVVTPTALKSLINQILAPYTEVESQVFESVLDRWFVSDGTAVWHSFVGDGLDNVGPQYPDRRYDTRPQSDPGGAWAFDEHNGRYLLIRIPYITTEEDAAFAFGGTQSVAVELGLFLTDGTVTDGDVNGYLFSSVQASLAVYQAVANAVQQAKGHGIRFMLLVDPKLR